MSEFVWEEPPAPGRGPGAGAKFTGEAEALRSNPGRWLMLKEYPANSTAREMSSRINKGVLVAFGSGSFEAVSRGTKVYVRFVGRDQKGKP